MGRLAEVADAMGAGLNADPLELACAQYGVSTPMRQAHFLAQLSVESAGFSRTVESLNYSVAGLLTTFGRHRISRYDAMRYGRLPGRPAKQREIANAVYGGQWGLENLGNYQPDDGWTYRGHGLGQITGRNNTARISLALFGTSAVLLDDPGFLCDPDIGAKAAAWHWFDRNCNTMADADDIRAVTKRWNGGHNGLKARIKALARAKQLLGIA